MEMKDSMRRGDKWDSPTCLHIHLLINHIMGKKGLQTYSPALFPHLLLCLSLIHHILDEIGFHWYMEDFNCLVAVSALIDKLALPRW